MSKPLPTAQQMRDVLTYCPLDGTFVWKPRGAKYWDARFAGKPAFYTVSNRGGYLRGCAHSIEMSAHRVAWAIYYGEWPDGLIDHINGDPLDNRITNLRVVDKVGNGRNAKMPITNTSGYVGVRRASRSNRWLATIRGDNDKHIYLGLFVNIEDAVAARKAAEKRLGYHPNHGRRA